MKKIIAILLVCVMAMGLIPMMASADETWSWTLTDGVLTVTGTGEVGEATSSPESYPWHDKRAEVTAVVIGDGITYLGKNSFTQMKNLTKITVGKDCTKLGMDTFSYNKKITSIEFKGTIIEMAQGVFYGTVPTEGTVAITLCGQTKEQFMAIAAAAPYNCTMSKPDAVTCLDSATYTVIPATGPVTVKDVVVYYPASGVAMTATANGTKLTGVAATKDGNKLVVDDNTYVVLTMTTEADGTFTLQNAAGEYLTSGATGNGVSFAAEKTDLAVWVMDGIFIKNTTAAYDNIPQYLEYYSGFTTFGKRATDNEEAYTFELIDAANVSVKGVTPPEPPVTTGDATVIIAVVAIVALFGTAVVVTKKVTER